MSKLATSQVRRGQAMTSSQPRTSTRPRFELEWDELVAEVRLLERIVTTLRTVKYQTTADELEELIAKRKNLATEQALKHYDIHLPTKKVAR